MNGYDQAIEELTKAFKHLQAGRDLIVANDPALKTSFESCMQFLAVLIADLQSKVKAHTKP